MKQKNNEKDRKDVRKRMLTEGVIEGEKNKSKKRNSLTLMPRKWLPLAMTRLFT